MQFRNRFISKIYKYLLIHDGETILIKDIVENTRISKPTVIKYVRWLERRQIIKKTGKKFEILPV